MAETTFKIAETTFQMAGDTAQLQELADYCQPSYHRVINHVRLKENINQLRNIVNQYILFVLTQLVAQLQLIRKIVRRSKDF